MRINLHSLVLAPAVLAAAAFIALPASAASIYRVHVPFDFVASGTTLPAGDYVVRPNPLGSNVQLLGKSSAMFLLLGPGTSDPRDARTILTFDKIGQNHLLRTVQAGGMITNRLDQKYGKSLAAEEQITGGE